MGTGKQLSLGVPRVPALPGTASGLRTPDQAGHGPARTGRSARLHSVGDVCLTYGLVMG